MQKENPVIKNYILSSEKYVLKEDNKKRKKDIYVLKMVSILKL